MRQLIVDLQIIREFLVISFSLLDLLIQTELTAHVLLSLLVKTLKLLGYCQIFIYFLLRFLLLNRFVFEVKYFAEVLKIKISGYLCRT